MSDYLSSFSSYGPGVWNPTIPNFAAGQGANPYAVPLPVDYASQLADFAKPLPGAVADPGLWERFKASGVFNSTQSNGTMQQGWGGPALALGQGVFNAWMGMKQYGLAKDQLAETKRQFGLNYDAQVKTTNAALEDRQRARVASNPGAYQSVGDYMGTYGISKG